MVRPINRIRNIGLMAHIDAGKTTTTERILFYTGKTHRIGEVHTGESQMDWMELEKERGITITAASTSCWWQDYQINIIDTPGHVDFTVEVERSLRVLDGAICICCAVVGVEPQSETVWRQANRYRVPRLVFVNKMDRRGADFEGVVAALRRKLAADAVPIQYPLGEGSSFYGIIDVVEMKSFVWESDEPGAEYRQHDIPEEFVDKAENMRLNLLEKLAEKDDLFMEEYLEGVPLSRERIKEMIRKCTLDGDFFPVLCGAAFRNRGIQPLLDAVVDYLPAPSDLPPVTGILPSTGDYIERSPVSEEPFSALAFKALTDPYVGRLTYFRVYSGEIKAGSRIYNSSADRSERILNLVRMHANKRQEIDRVSSGDIAAASGLKYTVTGDTLCEETSPIILETMVFPDPVVMVAIEPRSKSDENLLMGGLKNLAEEDPTFKVNTNRETGQTIISGMGELHLEVLVERLVREYSVHAKIGQPQVAYRETLTVTSEVEAEFKRTDGAKGLYGKVVMRFEPLPLGTGFLFENELTGNSIPREYVPAVQRGIEEAMTYGIIGGYPVVDFRAVLLGGAYDMTFSNEMAFRMASSMALKLALEKGKPVILEPMMSVEVLTPEDFLGEIISDITIQMGSVEGVDDRAGSKVVSALVPLSSMFGYMSSLRSKSQGRATFTMQFAEYRQAPKAVQEKILKTAGTGG